MKLIKEMKSMWSTKLLINSKKVHQPIPEDGSRTGVKNKDLVDTLGVRWNTETDTFEFRKKLKQKPLTRRRTLSLLSSVYDPLGLAAPFLISRKL